MNPPNKKRIEIVMVVSIIAVALSQFKPLYTYFERPDIEVFVEKKANIYNYWGHVQAKYFLHFVNNGNARGIVRKVEFLLKGRHHDYIKLLKGQSYDLQPDTVGPNDTVNHIPLSYIIIEPSRVWSSFVNVHQDYKQSQNKKISELTVKIKKYIYSKITPVVPPQPLTKIKMDNKLSKEVNDFTKSNMKGFVKGEYDLLVLVWLGKDENPSLKKAFSFAVYESDIEKFRVKEGGIYLSNLINYHHINLYHIMIEIKDNERIGKLYKSYQSI